MLLSQECALIPIGVDEDGTGSLDLDSFRVNEYNHATILISHSASVTGNNVLKVYAGATVGAKTAALTFKYRYGGAAEGAANADVLSAIAESAALTLTAATFQGRILVIEVDAAEMQSGGTQYGWLTVNFDGTASVGTVSAFAILSQPRYAQAVNRTQTA